VNFTILGIHTPIFNSTTPSILFLIGMASPVKIGMSDIIASTVPFPLIPGVNLIAAINLGIRQTFTNPITAALGMFQTSKVFWTSQLTAVYPDPSDTIPQGKNISTIRIFVQGDLSDTKIVSDYRATSALSGFSTVGGLWTTLSGIFAILFGGSLFHLISGSKPLSIFGVAHSFWEFQKMKKELIKHYPQILERESDETRGLLAFLRDHLIDLKALEVEEDLGKSSQPLLDAESALKDEGAREE